jgi:hypothetical protein
MLNRLESYCYQLTRELGQFDQQHWMIVFCLTIVVGAFLLRGYGLRS